MQIIPFKSSFTAQDYGVFICFLLCIYTFMLTLLMFNKFTYFHEHTFNRRNQATTENPVLCVLKANQER